MSKIIIVGGVAGGATALSRLRRLDENAEILLLEKGEYVSFANCGLPYYIGGVIKNRESLFVSNIKSIEGKYAVQIRNFSEVLRIDSANKRVLVRDLKKGTEYYEGYDKLLLSTGSHPFVPPMEGAQGANVFPLWTIPDTDKIYSYLQSQQPKKAVVAGGGFVGIEMAENLAERGMDVTLVEFAPQILPPLDPDMAKIVENHVRAKGIRLLLNTAVKGIGEEGRRVLLGDGESLDTDMVILSLGVRPNTGFLKDSGITLNERGGVLVNERMETSVKDIYAIGDMIAVHNGVSGQSQMIPLAGIANKQGRAVAANILGQREERFECAFGTSIVKVFDLTAAAAGENEKSLQARGLVRWRDYGIALIHPSSHASYYPGALPMSIKLLFAMDGGKVLGAQIVGYEGVDKRIDSIAAALHFGGSVYDLYQLELAYAPPYSSAKDPVNMAGYAASNIVEGLTSPITYEEYLAAADQVTLLDVRESIERKGGFVEGSLNMPLSRLRSDCAQLSPDKDYVVHCAVGLRGYLAERILKQKGYRVRNLLGGWRTISALQEKERQPERMNVDQDKLPQSREESFQLDTCGLSCPGPIVAVSKKLEELREGDILEISASDPGFFRDIESFCSNMGSTLLSKEEKKGVYTARIQKGAPVTCHGMQSGRREKTMIIFDGDLDKAIAAFIIANGALAMGNKVNMFFTFWGLNILRRSEKVPVSKSFLGKLFAAMMPRGAGKLGLSKMNFAGAGAAMIKGVMKKNGVSSLEALIQQAIAGGARILACQMSMDVMGIQKEELIDGVEVGGVAAMLHDSDNSNMNLFI